MPSTSPFKDLTVIGGSSTVAGTYGQSQQEAWTLGGCPSCGGTQLGVVAHGGGVAWLRCVNCLAGLVVNGSVISPPTKPLRIPKGLPPLELAAWQEARECLAVGANTATVMMCRKILFHVAVGHGLPPKDSKGRAPSFLEAVKHLEQEGLITKRMRPWVDRIKDVGNEANHEIESVTSEVALDVATFTEQLLVLAYELDALMTQPRAAVDE